MQANPDFLFNMAMINQVVEEYQKAYNGFRKAFELDNTLSQAKQQSQAVLHLVKQINNLIKEKGNLKKRQIEKMVATFPDLVWTQSGIQEYPIAKFTSSDTPVTNAALSLCLVKLVSDPNSFPLYVAIMHYFIS